MIKKGFTLIELLAVIIILGVIMAIVVPQVQRSINASKDKMYDIVVSEIIKATKNYTVEHGNDINGLKDAGIGYITVNELVANGAIDELPKNPKDGGNFSNNATVRITVTTGGKYNFTFYEDSPLIVNTPLLTSGMKPVKWDGNAWVETTESDPDWYSYDTTNKKWANAKTKDGSMWVWIPRYIYKITSYWHSNTTGTIDIKFSKGIDDTIDGTVTLNTDDTANASNNTWTNHPAFTFGDTELAGLWVAKFEPSDDGSNNVKIAPGVVPIFEASIGEDFTNSRNMENNSVYGWGTSGDNIDTHMTKNTEWGAIAYLAKSNYGKTTEITPNTSEDVYTGGGISNAYVSNTDQSTTGNVYGIYDMSGGVSEYTAAYVNNSDSALNTYGSSIIAADEKYKDIYQVGTPDDATHNYNLAINKKGDAIYETSSNGVSGYYAWYGDFTGFAQSISPWFSRSADYDAATYLTTAGPFYFNSFNGSSNYLSGFRPIVIVGPGL